MQKLIFLLLVSALFAVGISAPTQLEAANVEELLAEIENDSTAVDESYEMAEIEQRTLRELLGNILDGSNNYAQSKLNTDDQDPDNLEQLLGRVLNRVNNYAQNKLQPEEQEQAEIEQRNFRELLQGVLNGVNNYAQNKLNPDNRDPSNTKQLFGRFLGNANELVQRRLQRPRSQAFELSTLPYYPRTVTIEQATLKELAQAVLKEIDAYFKDQLEPTTDSLDYEEASEEDMEVDEQAIGAILAPIVVSVLSNLASDWIGKFIRG